RPSRPPWITVWVRSSKSAHLLMSCGQLVVTTRRGASTSSASTKPSFFSTVKDFRTVLVFPLPGGRKSLTPPSVTISLHPRICSERGSHCGFDFIQGDCPVVVDSDVMSHTSQHLVRSVEQT